MQSKVAIFNWGEMWIHTYYLAEQLNNNGIGVDLYLYIPLGARSSHIKTLIQNLQHKNIRIIELQCTLFEAGIMELNKIVRFLHYPLPALFTNFFLPSRTRKHFKVSDYKYVITISHYSLYWLYKTDSAAMSKTIHYSLEIEKITDPYIKKNWNLHAIIRQETKLLKCIKGLIIQDNLRLNALLNSIAPRRDLKVFYIPVSIPGNIITTRSDYLYKELGLQAEQKIILYFGAVYRERKLTELAAAFSANSHDDQVLVFHCGGAFPDVGNAANIKISRFFLEFDELHLIISSASIGIALYDNGTPNNRLTAFSSEKVARYLQAGVPFIALKNESYSRLKNEFNCCELIEDISEVNNAINIIMSDYESYRNNCYKAFNKYYTIGRTIQPLVEFLVVSGE